MIPTIDNFSFIGWPDKILWPSFENRTNDRPGVDGSGVVWDAYRAKPQTITTTAICNSNSEAGNLITGYRGLIKSQVRIMEPTGLTWNNVLIMDAQPQSSIVANGQWMVDCTWTILIDAAA